MHCAMLGRYPLQTPRSRRPAAALISTVAGTGDHCIHRLVMPPAMTSNRAAQRLHRIRMAIRGSGAVMAYESIMPRLLTKSLLGHGAEMVKVYGLG